MPQIALYGISILFSFVAWGLVTAKYIWPRLRLESRNNALYPLMLLHCFRFIGLAFLIPGVVTPDLSIEFAKPAAYGDLIAAILALLSLASLRTKIGIVLVWLFNCWGTVDLLHAFYQGFRVALVPGQLGAAYFIPTVPVPFLLITHGLVFRLLLSKDQRNESM
jgi:hypothetical protein